MSVTASLDLPKCRSARILTSPPVTVSPRNRLPHRARNGHAHDSGSGKPAHLQALCDECNRGKSNTDQTDFRLAHGQDGP
jgi:hypothetical protein